MLKTNAMATPLKKSAVGSPYGCHSRAVRSPIRQYKTSAGAHKGRCANAVVIRGICTGMSLQGFSYANLGPNFGPFPIVNLAKTSQNDELH